MKGIILAGGTGSRLFPITKSISKQLLPVYNKPLIYYPISILMLAGIKEILIITTPRDKESFKDLLGDGVNLGIKFYYKTQETPKGLADAFIVGKDFIKNDSVCLVLGDNFIYGGGLQNKLSKIIKDVETKNISYVIGYEVDNPKEFGIAEINKSGNIISIEEKPQNPRSNLAIIGLYFYPNDVINKALKVQPSERGEIEITSINQMYLKSNRLKLEKLSRGYVWFDTGNSEDLLKAGEFVRILEQRTGLGIAVLEEIAIRMGYIKAQEIKQQISNQSSKYYQYLNNWIDDYWK